MKSIFVAFSTVVLVSQLHADTFTVTSNADSGPGTLRQAIADADSNTGPDTIDFDSGLNSATILLTSAELLIEDQEVTIDASSLATGITISGDNARRVVHINGTADVTLKSLTITEGLAASAGGLLLQGGNLEMSDCTVSNSTASGLGGGGGGIYLVVNTTATLNRCSIIGNSANNSTGLGGGIFIGGATTPSLQNCLISGNTSFIGGGLMISNSSPTLTNCTIQGNSSEGIRNDDANTVIENCILWGNSGASGNTAAQQLFNDGTSNPSVASSLIQAASSSASFNDGNAVSWGVGNLNGTLSANDPKFVSPIGAGSAPHSGGDLRLLQSSTSIDSGDNSVVIGSLDLAGSTRIQNTDVDLGAYEGAFATFSGLYGSLIPTEDTNENGVSNFKEYAMGFDPTATDNGRVSPRLSSDSGFSILTVNQRSNSLDTSSLLQTSDDLDPLNWIPMVQGVHYTIESSTSPTLSRETVEYRLIDSDPWRFYRQGIATQ